jgi:hypothetical protein
VVPAGGGTIVTFRGADSGGGASDTSRWRLPGALGGTNNSNRATRAAAWTATLVAMAHGGHPGGRGSWRSGGVPTPGFLHTGDCLGKPPNR